VENHIKEIFPQVLHLLEHQDVDMAREIMKVEDTTGKTAEKIVSSIIQEQWTGLSISDAVTLSLYARHLKRINAHLTNIASAIVNPFPRIGFREKKKKKNKNKS